MASFQKHPSFGDLVQKFSQAYMLRPGGVKGFDAGIPAEFRVIMNGVPLDAKNEKHAPHKDLKDEGEELFHEAESDPLEESEKLSQKLHILECLVNDTFATISALKSAYIKLQAAHSPYDPERLRVADKAIISELRRLSELKHSFREKQAFSNSTLNHGKYPKSSPEDGEEDMVKKFQELENTFLQKQKMLSKYEGYIETYKRRMEEKNAEIENLKASLEKVTAKKDQLESRVRKLEHQSALDQTSTGLSSEQSAKPSLFELVVEEAKEAASNFAKLLTAMMKSAHWDLDAAAKSIEPGVFYSRPAHKKYAFESYICHRMFSGFENENFYMNGSLSSILDPEKHRHECLIQFQDMRSIDPLELVSITPDCLFGKFCHKKYLQIVHEKMEESFFGDFEHRGQILNGVHPRSRFYQSFLKFAKAVWLVHKLAFSFSPTVKIFQVRKDCEFHPLYMESVVDNEDLEYNDPSVRPTVALTVTPGFRIEEEVLKCRVYLQEMLPGE
ncbi:hypothetical protein O6H91_04G132000 [Diphasiastrum complanatum]|uniref:Uncharacterized protein n=5 Tax=Diphasiastrum complanatum TaxID=34168 RepID=A0ACC2E207_DIPCM|nr:hypothetical protein O6H91_04G132000 [Diphasiastrum complanatum]KAJ7560489.1 hypothetical protein O6H91_04G132000 [Diphasiastrum complanatum]